MYQESNINNACNTSTKTLLHSINLCPYYEASKLGWESIYREYRCNHAALITLTYFKNVSYFGAQYFASRTKIQPSNISIKSNLHFVLNMLP